MNYITVKYEQIQDGEIYAKINQRDGMVVFLDNKEKYDSAKMMQKIENQVNATFLQFSFVFQKKGYPLRIEICRIFPIFRLGSVWDSTNDWVS